MIRRCAWCERLLGQTPPLEDPAVTHSVCPTCSAELLRVGEKRDAYGQEDGSDEHQFVLSE